MLKKIVVIFLISFIISSYAIILIAICYQQYCEKYNVPEKMTIYSIDGLESRFIKDAVTDETFHKFPVLGKLEIKDAEKRKEIMNALKKGLDEGAIYGACFWPRHAIRIEQKGKIIDYIICFECSQFHTHENGSVKVDVISLSPLFLINKQLKEAGVLLAPSRHNDD